MNIIIPMAGMGTRLRPHTLTTPKPLIPVAGSPIAERLVKEIAKVMQQPIDKISFIIKKSFGKEIEQRLLQIAQEIGAKGQIDYQNEALGTAHAIYSAKTLLNGPVVVAYADTLFKGSFDLDEQADSIIWVKKVNHPEQFGVVKLNDKKEIEGFVEKPQTFVSDLAIIGIYYFKNGEVLRNEIEYLFENNITVGGEYQLTTALENMKQKSYVFKPGTVSDWMDFGNPQVAVQTNTKVLQYDQSEGKQMIAKDVELINSEIIEPCYIDSNVKIINSTVGPNVSLGKDCIIENSHIENALIQNHNHIKNAGLKNAMIGNFVQYDGNFESVSLGDYSSLK
jgi:glucose-1-phosphate thymidylyltransferase